MPTVLKILELFQVQMTLMGEITELKISLAELKTVGELRMHERGKHGLPWDHASHLSKTRDLRERLEDRQAKLNALISGIAKQLREFAAD